MSRNGGRCEVRTQGDVAGVEIVRGSASSRVRVRAESRTKSAAELAKLSFVEVFGDGTILLKAPKGVRVSFKVYIHEARHLQKHGGCAATHRFLRQA